MATKTEAARIAELETQVAEIAGEIEELAHRRDDATATIERAQRRFEELVQQRTALSPKAFSGDEEAATSLERIEDEHDTLARSVRVAESAAPEFSRMIAEAEERRDAAQTRVYRARAEGVRDELEKAEGKRDELAARLVRALEDHARAVDDYRKAVSLYDRGEAGHVGADVRGAQARWVFETFARWLR